MRSLIPQGATFRPTSLLLEFGSSSVLPDTPLTRCLPGLSTISPIHRTFTLGLVTTRKESIMANITVLQVTELSDTKLQKIAERIALEAELAVEKVAASFTQPSEYPLTSDAKSIERILESHFNTLPQTTKEAAAATAINRINAPAAERAARYGNLASVNLTNAKAIDTQVQELPFSEDLKLPPDHPIIIFNLRRQERVPAVVLRQQTTNKLELRIHKVKCLDEISRRFRD